MRGLSGALLLGSLTAALAGGLAQTSQGRLPGPAAAAVPRPAPTLTLGTGASQRVLGLAQLRALPSVTYEVRHPQLGRSFVYRGATLRDLAVAGGFGGQDLRLYASNGYLTLIRARDYLKSPIMVAYEADGHAITVLDKGPLTVVLPPEPARYRTPAYTTAWVWYVNRVTPAPPGPQGGKGPAAREPR